ncbi:hypothetical protein HYU15_01405 [Candidatus Woesearchaeota archaeon]|nr:hypothetical protein [Candidatus Woesearchaeota archaeon]
MSVDSMAVKILSISISAAIGLGALVSHPDVSERISNIVTVASRSAGEYFTILTNHDGSSRESLLPYFGQSNYGGR